MRRLFLVATALALPACGGGSKPQAEAPRAAAEEAHARDSLILTTRAGAEVWFVAERPANDSSGAPCTERAMEIRWAGKATPIPLLYTGATPHLVNDTTIEAAIWLHCRPGNVYRVDLHTGRPVRVK
ncbi:MAG: hypothetical protein ABI742_02210 [Gemmatimonadota bacterium]